MLSRRSRPVMPEAPVTRRMRRTRLAHVTIVLPAALLVVAGAFAATPLGCAEAGSRAPAVFEGEGGTFGDGDGGIAALEGLTAIRVEPPSVTLAITYATPMPSVDQAFTATGTFEDGTTRDVTSYLTWTVIDEKAPLFATGGHFSANVPGEFTIVAAGAGQRGTATATVKLTGSVVLPSIPAANVASLDGTPSGNVPTVVYPADGALFPSGLALPSFQLQKGDAAQSFGRVEFTGDVVDLRVYGACETVTPSVMPGCAITLPTDLEPILAGASTGATLSERIRLVAEDGGKLGESTAIDARWAFDKLGGALYYWRALNHETATAISRFNLDTPGTPPEDFFVNNPDSPPIPGDQHPCVGCHAITPDGSKMALTFGGSIPSSFGLLDIATKTFIAAKTTDANGFATETTFAPDSTRLINQFRGELVLRTADATLAPIGSPLFSSVGEKVASPFWAPDGRQIAFVGWQPNQNGASDSITGDLVRGGEIWLSDADGTAPTGTPRLLLPRIAGKTQTYPAISDDGKLLVYTETSCDGPTTPGPYGNDPCDGYDDPSARVKAVVIRAGAGGGESGGNGLDLLRANGGPPPAGGQGLTWANSWPRFGPTHSTFRGKTLYWITFSSRRPYGLVLPGSTNGNSKPQLWIAAVTLDSNGDGPSGTDPSFAPVWMPGQNDDLASPTGNHVPQWVTKFVQVIR